MADTAARNVIDTYRLMCECGIATGKQNQDIEIQSGQREKTAATDVRTIQKWGSLSLCRRQNEGIIVPQYPFRIAHYEKNGNTGY